VTDTNKVSVIIPNYNHAVFLKQRIDSILNQTYQDFEVIILDDSSTDNSVEIIESYRNHPKVSQIVINDQNGGSPFLQWQKGIQLAKGEWIWIAESDDWCEPELLEELLKLVNDNTGIAFCQSIAVNQNGKKVWQSRWPSEHEEIEGKKFISKYLLWGNYIVNASMSIFRKMVYEQISNKFIHFKVIGDWMFWIELSTFCNVAVSNKQLNYFRNHECNTSGLAYTTGLVYIEFLSLVEKLKKDKLITAQEELEMLKHQFYEFLNDKRVLSERYRQVYKQFQFKLGVKFFLFHCKNWIVKKVKSPLYRRMNWNQRKFEHFTRFPDSDNFS